MKWTTSFSEYLQRALAIFAAAGLMGQAGVAMADRIDPSAFTSAAIVDPLSDIAPSNVVLNHSITRDGYQIHSNVSSFIYSASGGVDGNGYLLPNSPAGIANIVFDNPWQKAGVSVFNVGVTQINFFGGQGNYLGGVTFVSGPAWSTFAWDGGSEGVGMIQVVEGEFGRYIGFDAITRENMITPVPEPETWAMMLAGLALLGFAANRRRLAK
jgi:hypothetical protein